MTDAELAEIAKWHQCTPDVPMCQIDGEHWPCDAYKLLIAYLTLRTEVFGSCKACQWWGNPRKDADVRRPPFKGWKGCLRIQPWRDGVPIAVLSLRRPVLVVHPSNTYPEWVWTAPDYGCRMFEAKK